MALYRFLLTPKGPLGTPLRSDTLNGHIICAAAEQDGPHVASDLVEAFRQGEPPFVCSSAFPKGMLPRPCLPPISRRYFREKHGENLFSILNKYKKFRKRPWLPLETFQKFGGGIGQADIFVEWLLDQKKFHPEVQSPPGKKWEFRANALEPHNSIDRTTAAVLQEGGLYFTESIFYCPGVQLHLYVETEDLQRLQRYLDHISETGFGRDRSTGKGTMDIQLDTAFDAKEFERDGSHRLTLSVFSGPDLSMVRGWYDAFVKSGKVYNGFGQHNPFKKPFLALAEGAVLEPFPEKAFVLDDIHADPAIVQITWPLTIPINPVAEEVQA